MDSTLLNNRNSLYFQQANLLSGTPQKIHVIVEDIIDVPVWYKILNKAMPDKIFEFLSFSNDAKAQGKVKVLEMSDNFGPYLVGCIDSDFDWLLEDYTEDGEIIKRNKYIFQTYAYSIENLSLQPYGLSKMMVNSTLNVNENISSFDNEIIQYINKISRSVYPVLIWHLFFRKQDKPNIKPQDGWDYIFKPNHYNNIMNETGVSIEAKRSGVLKIFDTRCAELIECYRKRFLEDLPNVKALEDMLSVSHNLMPENAYLFVRGHDLYGFLHHVFFTPIEKNLINDLCQKIINSTTPVKRENTKNYYHNNRIDFKTMQIKSTGFIEDQENVLWIKIREDIQRALGVI